MFEERIEGNITINQMAFIFSGFLTVQKNTAPFTWSVEIEDPSPDVRKMAFDGTVAQVDCCDGSGQGILVMSGPDDVRVRGSGPWTEK